MNLTLIPLPPLTYWIRIYKLDGSNFEVEMTEQQYYHPGTRNIDLTPFLNLGGVPKSARGYYKIPQGTYAEEPAFKYQRDGNGKIVLDADGQPIKIPTSQWVVNVDGVVGQVNKNMIVNDTLTEEGVKFLEEKVLGRKLNVTT